MAHYLFNFSRKGAARGKTLREQAGELLNIRLWGIGKKTPNRRSLAPRDRALIYVGAPEYEFIGTAELASETHEWTAEEARRYPGSFDGGVALSDAQLWSHPIPMKSILNRLELRATNPGAHFFSGVIRITEQDYEMVVAEARRDAGALNISHSQPSVPARVAPFEAPAASTVDLDLLFRTVERLKQAAQRGGSFSEYDTRAVFIDKYIEALGYVELDDVQRGSPVESGNFPDYVLRINGKPAIAIEAKKLGAPLGPREAAQVVGYCANLGVRWGAVTDGRYVKLYDAPMLGVSPEERRVLAVDLAEYRDRDDFETRIYPELGLIAKEELESGAGLARRVAQEAMRELLTTSSSKTSRMLRKELDEAKAIKVTPGELAELVSELLS